MKGLKKHSLAGQALIIGLLFVVVVSTLVLALISRSLKDVKVSTETKEELRAFSAAEAGLERVLNNPAAVLQGGGSTQVTIGNIQVNVTTQEAQWSNTVVFAYPDEVAQDEVRQFFLSKYDETTGRLDPSYYYTGGGIDVMWGRVVYDSAAGAYVAGPSQPGVEVTLYYQAVDGVKIKRVAFDKLGRGGFDLTSVVDVAGVEVETTFGKKRFAYKATFDFGLGAGEVPLFLRVRFLFNGNTNHPLGFGVPAGISSSYYPPQGYKIFSQADGGGEGAVQRLEAFKSFPILPAIFDYAIFSGSNLEKP